MKVKEIYNARTLSIDEALQVILHPSFDYSRGQLEDIQDEVSALKTAFIELAKMHIKSVDDLNKLAKFTTFEEVLG